MKVLIHVPLVNPGGGARLLSRLAEAIARQPQVASVRMIAGSSQNLTLRAESGVGVEEIAQPSWLSRDGRILGVKGTGVLKRHLRAAVAEGADQVTLQLRQAAETCDVVYFFWPHRQDFIALNRPTVCTFQDATFFDFPEILGTETGAEWRRSDVWLRETTEVVVSSEATRRAITRHFGAPGERATVIHHAILPAVPGDAATRQPELLARLPRNYVVCPANVITHKNHYTLLVAWARFARRRQHPLVLFGPGTQALNATGPDWSGVWHYDRIAGLIARLGLRANEDFYALGFVADKDVLPLVGSAAALVMPTLSEGGGSYPVEEALSLGVPVLCSDIPVMREHAGQRTARIAWFDPESPEAILGALNDLFNHYDAFKESAVAGMSDARPSWNDVAAQYVQVFARAIKAQA